MTPSQADRFGELLSAKASARLAIHSAREAYLYDHSIQRRQCLDKAIEALTEYLGMLDEPLQKALAKITREDVP